MVNKDFSGYNLHYAPLSREDESRFAESRDQLMEEIAIMRERLPAANGLKRSIKRKISYREKKLKGVRHEFAEANINLVFATAYRYYAANPDSDLDDVFGACQMAFVSALDGFDHKEGAKFSTYAVRAMNFELIKLYKYKKKHSHRSLEDSFNGSGLTKRETIEDDREKNVEPYSEDIARALKGLEAEDPRLSEIIRLRYGFNPQYIISSLQTVADKMGVSRERIRQLEKRALKMLKESFSSAESSSFA